MKIKKYIILILMAAMISAISSLCYAHEKGEGGAPNKAWVGHGEKFIKQLNLTEEQKSKITKQSEELGKSMKSVMDATKTLRAKMNDELKKDNPDKNILYKYIADINNNTQIMQKKRMDHILFIRSLLTPEQKAKFKELFNKEKKSK